MAKKEVSPVVEELQKKLAEGRLIFGAKQTLDALRNGNAKKVFLASNCRESVKEDLTRYCDLSGVECVFLEQVAEEVGTLCKKPFSISVVGAL